MEDRTNYTRLTGYTGGIGKRSYYAVVGGHVVLKEVVDAQITSVT
jgi:hypothetical protein